MRARSFSRYGTLLVAAALFARLAALPAAADVREEAVSVPIAVGQLAGTLLLPSGSGPFPVALIIAGSGPTDRDGNSPMYKMDSSKKLAQDLAARGIATLRYDKRSIGASTVKQAEIDMRFEDFVGDALAMAALLERDTRFSSVSIIGHSEGALIGTLVAERDPHVRALVLLEGAGRDLASIIDEQIQENPNVSPAILAEVKRINTSLRAGKTVPNLDPLLAMLFRPSVQPYLISEYKYDPAQELAKLEIPILIVHGTTDIQVGLVDERRLAAAAPKAHVAVIEGMNHILVDAPADRAANIATYSEPALPLSAGLVPAIATFLR